jgi:Flp pilus assembly protein TadG
LASRLWRDIRGAVLLEFTVVFPVLMVIVLGSVDAAYLGFDWATATKTTYLGARFAAANDPVAGGITNDVSGNKNGQSCFSHADGTVNATANCPTISTVCTATAGGGSCTNNFAFQNGAFNRILQRMQRLYPSLDRRQIQISYQTTGLGYVGRPHGPPMNVTVSLRCMTHPMYFLPALASWAFPALPANCQGVPTQAGLVMPTFSTTLPTEDLETFLPTDPPA